MLKSSPFGLGIVPFIKTQQVTRIEVFCRLIVHIVDFDSNNENRPPFSWCKCLSESYVFNPRLYIS